MFVKSLHRTLGVYFLGVLSLPSLLPAALQETWETGYTPQDATAPHVLGLWKFDGETPWKDHSGKGNDLTPRGVNAVSGGKFSGGMESFPGFPVEDKNHGAVTPAKTTGLSPRGAFTLEMWVNPKPELSPTLRPFLLDKKYVDQTDYQWTLSDADKAESRFMAVNLGFGTESKAFYSNRIKLPAGEWHHLAFTYDGAGEGTFYLDGQRSGVTRHPGFGAIMAGTKPLSIGDRLGSNYGGFPGFIDEVRISDGVLEFQHASMRIESARTVWRRMESAEPAAIVATNLRRAPLSGAKLHLSLGGQEQTIELPELAPGKTHTATFPIDTALKPDLYTLRARLDLTAPKAYSTEQTAEMQIVPRPLPSRMPVIMWGASPENADQLKEIGFTHCLGLRADYDEIWKQGKPLLPGRPDTIASVRRELDRALAKDLGVIASISPMHIVERDSKYLRVGRDGKPYERQDICASMPELPPFFENAGRGLAMAYGDHPAFSAALIDTEVRDSSTPSFNAVDVENYRKFSGGEIPAEVKTRGGVLWSDFKDFPPNRVIPDDHPILKYYRWFWTEGDGWNALHSAVDRGVKTSGRKDVFTWFDPAVRQPSIGGAGGSVDMLSHWTYTYPDPQRIGLCTDQLFAMSEANGRQQEVIKMTQIIWYRSQTAPTNSKPAGDTVAWEDHDPDAAYITIAPIHLREAFWTKLSRPIQGIMYHGWQSLVPSPGTSAYRYTNPHTVHVLKDLVHRVVEPLGPTLRQIPGQRSEVAFLESFTSQMFARRGGYGSNMDWATDVWLALQHAHFQTDILFEETLLKNGLEGRKVLVMPFCDVLTESVVAKIQAWQKAGGKIIADEYLCPALKADVLLPSFKRAKKAAEDKAKTLEIAKLIQEQSGKLGVTRKADCDNPEILLQTRQSGDALYVFAVNDRREFGRYVGQHGLVMENGLPSSGKISVSTETAEVYDLISGERIPTQDRTWNLALGPGDGRIFMVLPKPLPALKVEAPETAARGKSAPLTVTIPTQATLPLQVTIRDANGLVAERSGYYGMTGGKLEIPLDIATNDEPGSWEIRIRELASNRETVRFLRVE